MSQAVVTPIMPGGPAQADDRIGAAVARHLRNAAALLALPEDAGAADAARRIGHAIMLVEDVLAAGSGGRITPDMLVGVAAHGSIDALHVSLLCTHGSIGDTLPMADVIACADEARGRIVRMLECAA